MKCPRVIDTRVAGDGIRRRRECKDCNKRFTTYERVALSAPMIVKRDGRREPFDRDKLVRGIQKACAKRPIAIEDIERLVNQVEHRVHSLGKAEVDSRMIGDMVMEGLRELDDIAYILFASVYIPIADLDSMKREVDRLTERR